MRDDEGNESRPTRPSGSTDACDDVHCRVLRALGIGVLKVSERGDVLWMDPRAKGLLEHALVQSGAQAPQLLTIGHGGKRPWEFILQRGTAQDLAYEVRDADGKLVPVVFGGTVEEGPDGTREVVLLVRTTETCEHSEDPYWTVFDEVNDGIVVQDIGTGAILDMNRRAAELYGYRRDDAPPTSPHETTEGLADEEHARASTLMMRAAKGEPQVFEWPAVDRDGRQMSLEVNLKRASIGGVDRLLAVVRDITDRKRTEQELRRSQERYRAIIEASHDLIWALDTKANFIFVNRRAEELTGYDFEEWKGKSFVPLVHPKDRPKSLEAFARTMAGEPVSYEVRLVDAHGRVRQLQVNLEPFREDGQILGMVGLGTDITERTHLEDELHKAQKLESLGLLAGGIAHDFNNILTAIVGGVTLAKRSMHRPEHQQETLEMAEKACLRARELTQQLLTFSRGGAPVRKPGSIAELLQETAQFSLRGSNVNCELCLQENLHIVEMDAGQMNQVVNNLLINAAQAMPNGGTIRLCAENRCIQGLDGASPTLRPGSYVRISVRDEGEGIPAAHLANIFDPYFTTKPSGMGLGLATSYSIVKRHEGHIEVETRPGQGTTFHIYLPSTERTRAPSEQPPVPESRRGGTVLLMDDDAMVREVGAEMLRLLGFAVVVVNDGRAAIVKYQEALASGKRFDAVILDLTVPGGMGGREAASILKQIDGHARLIASSGYSTDPVIADHTKYGFDGVVAKPYMPEDLDRAMGLAFNAR